MMNINDLNYFVYYWCSIDQIWQLDSGFYQYPDALKYARQQFNLYEHLKFRIVNKNDQEIKIIEKTS